jgi:single-strand DNA-binding protein
MDLNKVSLIGHLADDPVRQVRPTGTAGVRFLLVVTHEWADAKTRESRRARDRFTVEASGKLAEIIAAYVHQGSKLYVEGRLRSQRDAGSAVVLATNVIMLGKGTRERG